MEQIEKTRNSADNKQQDILQDMLAEQQEELGRQEIARWKIEKRVNRTRLMFILWLVLSIAVMGELLIVRIVLDIFPNPEEFGVRDFLVTPTTIWFIGGLFGFLTRKLLKQPYWNWKSTVAAVASGTLVLIVPAIQTVVVALYVLLIIMPGWYVFSFFMA